ncbi:MAG: DUF1857 family protein [Burkholderiaceae bacterium]|jgi:hypothetical protein|nr:DUF1857 family protein [Burkholderiaceae bacterium]
MRFEHIIEINRPEDPRVVPLTRLELWRGLVLRAEQPELFMPQLDVCTIVERSATSVTRRLAFGNLVIHDQVRYHARHRVHIEVPEQGEIPPSALVMTIEEPQPERLFVRFAYEDSSPDEGPDAFYNDFRRSAWREADIDTIRTIREMVATGRLSGPLQAG